MLRSLASSRGYSLLELTVAAAIAAMIVMAAADLGWRGVMASKSARESFERVTELRNGMAWVTRDLRRAETVAEAAPGSLVLAVGGEEVAYRLEGGDLARYENGMRRVVARGIAAANFSAEAREKSVLVAVELAGTDGGRARTAVLIPASAAGP